MTSPFVPQNFMYGDLPQGGQLTPMVVSARAPSNTSDKQYAAGYFWLSSLDMFQIVGSTPVYGNGNLYYQAGNSSGNPNWTLVGGISSTNGTAGASPQTSNGRSFTAIFSGVSIAAGATQSFTIANSYITDARTRIAYSMIGATTGAALNIQSVTNSAGQSVVVVENGTGATTSTANITFTGIILN